MDLDAAFASLPGLTTRGAQRTMASAVATALEREQPLLVHAPTGVGKSLGYLVPIAAAGRRAIVATATKALQSQLIDRDLPRLADAFQTTSALLMGRGNYVCLAKVDALVAATRLAATAQEEAALQVVDWAVDSDSGSRLDAPPGTRDDVWDLISTPGEDCPGQKGCSFFKRCFAERAKEQARDVDVVVTNHHLLLLELELRQASDSPGVMLPEVDAIIKASGSTSDWARRVRARWEDHASGLRPGPVLPGSRAAAELGKALDPVLREAQAASAALRGVTAIPDDLEGGMHAARRRLTALCRDLQRLREVEAPLSAAAAAAEGPAGDPDGARPAPGPDAPARASPVPRVDAPARASPVPRVDSPARAPSAPAGGDPAGIPPTSAIGDPGAVPPLPAADLAVWIEERRDGGRTIRSALVEPGEVLRDVLWDRVPTTVACSATLAVAGELEGTAATLGVERPDGLVVESPFDFRSNALLYEPRGVPAPTGDGFQAAAERELRALIEASEGRALVLCTSWRAVESFAAALTDLPWELLVQGEDTPARLAARFRDEVASVLVATRTFFEGVDVPGQSLSLLVLDRLPFPRPDDPLLAERGRRIERRGGSKFGEVWLPSAAVSLQQALGRLIRSESDRGVMAVLDRRLADAGYGRRLLVSLPPAPLRRSIHDVQRFFGSDDPKR